MKQPEIPGYNIIGALGEGGMASVYLAEQLSFGRPVALKILTPEVAGKEHFGHRFLREARIAASLSHPNIVSVFDTGVVENCYFLAMEHLSGGTLRQRQNAGISLRDSLAIVQDIADAIDYASKLGIVHRDLKPANILFREDGSLAIVDFGIARDLATETMVTQAGTILGTPHYMSPEQTLGEDLDHRSDLYSLGIIFFELLTGSVPFSGESAAAIGIKQVSAPVPRLPSALSDFQEIVDKALAKSPDNRYQSGHQLIDALLDLEERIGDKLESTVVTSLDNISSSSRGSLRASANFRRSRNRAGRVGRSGVQQGKFSRNSWMVPSISAAVVALGFLSIESFLLGNRSGSGDALPLSTLDSENQGPSTQAGNLKLNASFDDQAIVTPIVPIKETGEELTAVAIEQLDLAREALERGNTRDARRYIDEMEKPRPEHQSLADSLLAEIVDFESNQVERQKLVDRLDLQIAKGNFYWPNEDNAYQTIEDLEQTGASQKVLDEHLARTDVAANSVIESHINRGEYALAAREVARWEQQTGRPFDSGLKNSINAWLEEKETASRRLAQLAQEKLKLLKSAESRSTSNRQLLMVLREMLQLTPADERLRVENRAAVQRELASCLAYLSAGNVEEAAKSLNALEQSNESQLEVEELRQRVSERRAVRRIALGDTRMARDIVEKMEALTMSGELSLDATEDVARQLGLALEKLKSAQRMDPTLDTVAGALENTLTLYEKHFAAAASAKRIDAATVYYESLLDARLNSTASRDILKLMEQEISTLKKTPAHVFHTF